MSLDELIKHKLSGYESLVDAESIWQAVQPEPRRRRLLAWSWLLGLGLVILPGASRQERFLDEINRVVEAVPEHTKADAGGPIEPAIMPAAGIVRAEVPMVLATSNHGLTEALPETTIPAVPESSAAESSGLERLSLLEPMAIKAIPEALPEPPPLWVLGSKRRSHWYTGIGMGIYRPVRELYSRGEAGEQLLRRIRESETPLEVLGVEWQLGRELGAHWRLQTGLSVHQLTDRFAWSGQELRVDTVLGTQVILVGGMGDSTFIPGPVARYQAIYREKKSYNTYRFMDVPVLATFAAGEGPWRFTITGGVYVNVRTQVRGDRLGVDGDFGLLEEVTPMRGSVGYSYYAGMGGVWSAGERWKVFGQGGLRYFPGMLTESGGVIDQRYQWIGFQVGIRYQ